MAHMFENTAAASVKFSANDWQQFNQELRTISISGERLPEFVLQFSGVEAPTKN